MSFCLSTDPGVPCEFWRGWSESLERDKCATGTENRVAGWGRSWQAGRRTDSPCRRNEQTAWDELVDRYQKLVYAIPRRARLDEDQAADVFQDVFLTLVQKIDEINQPEKIRSWIVTTAKFKTWSIIRGSRELRRARSIEEMEVEMANIADESPLADDALIELEEQHLIRAGLRSLDERCRQILSMLYLHSSAPSYAEVGAAIGVGETSISPLRSRCTAKFRRGIPGVSFRAKRRRSDRPIKGGQRQAKFTCLGKQRRVSRGILLLLNREWRMENGEWRMKK